MTSLRIAPVLLLLVWAPVAQAQEYKGPIWGGSGGASSYNLDCGSTGVMVGVYGKAAMWIDQIGITCQRINADGTLGSTYTRGPVGGSGGTSATFRCPTGKVIGSLYGHAGAFVDAVGFPCWPWSPTTRRANYQTTQNKGGGIGSWANIFNIQQETRCPDEKVGKAIRGRYGSYIDSLQFICDDYDK